MIEMIGMFFVIGMFTATAEGDDLACVIDRLRFGHDHTEDIPDVRGGAGPELRQCTDQITARVPAELVRRPDDLSLIVDADGAAVIASLQRLSLTIPVEGVQRNAEVWRLRPIEAPTT